MEIRFSYFVAKGGVEKRLLCPRDRSVQQSSWFLLCYKNPATRICTLWPCNSHHRLYFVNFSGLGVTNNDDLTMMEHPPLLSPPIPPPPPPGMELGLGGPPPPPGMPFDSLFPPPHFIPPAPFMPPDAGMLPPLHLMPSIPPPPSGLLSDHHRPPPLGMIATGSFDVDYRRDLSDPPPPRRYPSPPRRYPSPLGSERSGRSDRSDRMDRYDDHFR